MADDPVAERAEAAVAKAEAAADVLTLEAKETAAQAARDASAFAAAISSAISEHMTWLKTELQTIQENLSSLLTKVDNLLELEKTEQSILPPQEPPPVTAEVSPENVVEDRPAPEALPEPKKRRRRFL